TAVRSLLAFRNVDFARPVYLSSVYGAVEVLPGVTALTVTTFARQASLVSGGAPIDIGIGRIDIGDFELPSLGNLTISMLEHRRGSSPTSARTPILSVVVCGCPGPSCLGKTRRSPTFHKSASAVRLATSSFRRPRVRIRTSSIHRSPFLRQPRHRM